MDEAHKITITICGDGGCGKSSITLRLVRSQWTSEYDPTIEDSYTLTRHVEGQTYHLALTDTAGQEEYRGLWAAANLRSDAFLLVYDITTPASLDQLAYFNDLIDLEADARFEAYANAQARHGGAGRGKKGGRGGGDGGFVRPVKIVAGNKCDLQELRQVPAQVGLEWAHKRGCGFMETSARNAVNVEETFALIVRRVVETRRLASPAADGLLLSDGDSHMRMHSVVSDPELGTRRAVTAPLTPLPSGPEKEISFPNDGRESGLSKFSELWSKVLCCL
jgi:GTPase KRas